MKQASQRNYFIGFGTLVLSVIVLFLAFQFAPSRADQEKTYVGSEACLGCHSAVTPKIVEGIQNNLHGKTLFRETQPQEKRGCEACHGPGSQHVGGPPEPGSTGITDRPPDPLKLLQNPPSGTGEGAILNPAKMAPKKADAVCLKCHYGGEHGQNWSLGKHSKAGLGCLSCHSLHKAGTTAHLLVKPTQSDLCFSCHKDQRHRFTLTSRHPLLEGRMSCTDCHNPHGSGNPGLLAREGNKLCASCHANYAGPYAVEHLPPVGGWNAGCLSCHQSHGSPNRRLLTLSDRGTCLQCHANKLNHNPGTNCLSCHPFIHGSNVNSRVPFSQP